MNIFLQQREFTEGAASFEPAETRAETYKGPNRRRVHRRNRGDRREEMRFEPDKNDRRVNPGRRAEDKTPKFW